MAVEASSAPVAFQGNPEVVRLFGVWNRAVASRPRPESPGVMDHQDLERAALRNLVSKAESLLPHDQVGTLRSSLGEKLQASGLKENTPIWRMTWAHHWGVAVLSACGIRT